MSIKKIIKLESIGRFTALSSVGDTQFRRLNLVYGPNGSGKTTLASVLRSLKTQDALLIQERALLGRTKEPFVELLLDSGRAVFKGTTWSTTASSLEIFDSTFVSENVYIGEQVAPENRKGLYQVVIGAPAVALANELDELDVEGRALSKEVANKESAITTHIQPPLTLEEFLLLTPQTNLDEEIAKTTSRLDASRKAQQIQDRPELVAAELPPVPSRVLGMISQGVQIVGGEVESKVREHLTTHTGLGGEQWLGQGLDFLRDGHECPFCAQDTSNSQVVTRFREFFSAAYRQRANDLKEALKELSTELGEDAHRRLIVRTQENDAAIAAWSDLLDLKHAQYSTVELEEPLRGLAEALRANLEAALANPAAGDTNLPDYQQHLTAYTAARERVLSINLGIQRANETIRTFKTDAALANRPELENQLALLRNSKARQETPVSHLCEELLAARKKKRELDKTKKEKREALDSVAQIALTQYEEAINILLEKFGANFGLTGTRPTFQGGKASSTYQISINNEKVELAPGSQARPSFRTTLSTGDKSTLALALFIASLARNTTLPQKTVIFDDPITSLDVFRSSATEHEITELASKAEQVVVFSHDPFFLKRLLEQNYKTPALIAQIERNAQGQSALLKEFDIEAYCADGARHDYFILRTFVEGGTSEPSQLRAVGRALRPYLESQLRYRFPDQFPPGTWLGSFIDKVRDATTQPLLSMKARLSELEALNEYSKKLHHSEDPTKNSVPDAAELRAFAKRAIALEHIS